MPKPLIQYIGGPFKAPSGGGVLPTIATEHTRVIADGGITESGGTVTSLQDTVNGLGLPSGRLYDYTDAALDSPTYSDASGYPEVSFSDSSQIAYDTDILIANPVGMWGVFKIGTFNASSNILYFAYKNTTSFTTVEVDASGRFTVNHRDNPLFIASAVSAGSWNVFGWINRADGTRSLWVNGLTASEAGVAGALESNGDVLTTRESIGGRAASSLAGRCLNGSIRDLGIIQGATSDAEMEAFLNALESYYGLTVSSY